MLENKYDDPVFFEKYSQMNRSKEGLTAAGEWAVLKQLFPDVTGKYMLDLGCGYGWHCQYAIERGAAGVVGIDLSQKMLEVAKEKTKGMQVDYQCMAIEDIAFDPGQFDIVLSSLALHYVASYEDVVKKVHSCLKDNGMFLFSVEHPVFTAYGTQDWYYGEQGEILHFPVDNYYYEGKRSAHFLGEEVIKYHRTLTTYVNQLLLHGFEVQQIVEPQPTQEMIDAVEGMADEMRRPMMLIVLAQKRRSF